MSNNQHVLTAARSPAAPTIICVAPNGARRTKTDHPALPMTTAEIVEEAVACADAGASVIHLHIRDDKGQHSLDASRYRSVVQALDRELGERMLVQVTTEAVGIYHVAQQRQLLRELRPRAASVAICELVPDASEEAESASLFAWAAKIGVALQYIVYSPAEASRLIMLARAGVIPDARPNTLFVLGRYTAGQQSDPRYLLPFLNEWPSDWPWSVCAFGKNEALCMAAAISLGGHVRVGFENNLILPDGQTAPRNADLVANIANIASRCGRRAATQIEARHAYNAR